MDAPHGNEAARSRFAVAGDVFIRPVREAHEIRARIVDEEGPGDAVEVEALQETLGALHDDVEFVEVVPPPGHDVEDVGVELPPGLDVDVSVGDRHGGGRITLDREPWEWP